MRRTAGGGRRRAQPDGVPVSSTSPGAILAKVDSSEMVSAGLNTRLAVSVGLARDAVDGEAQVQPIDEGELLRLEHGQPRADRTEAAVALALEELHLRQLDVAGAEVVGDGDSEHVVPRDRPERLLRAKQSRGGTPAPVRFRNRAARRAPAAAPSRSRRLIEASDLVKNMLNAFASGSMPDSIMCWR